MHDTFDGIILGTGHNALVLQAYLSRCGLKTVSLDRAEVPGGGLATIENPRLPGFLHNTHSFFHRALSAMPWYGDLELGDHGARYVEPQLNVAMILADGRVLEWWTDFEKTYASFAAVSPRDADTLRRWVREFEPIVENILLPEAQSPPLPPARRRELLARSALGRRLLEVQRLSPLEFVRRQFEHPAVQAGLLFFNGLREVDLRLRGFGHSIPALMASRHKAQMCLGGSARLAEALRRVIQRHGGEVRTGVALRRLMVDQGRVTGVQLADGRRLEARRFVASGLNPQQTYLELLGDEVEPLPQRERARRFRYNLLAPLFALNVALREPPRYTAEDRYPQLQQAFMVILGLERLEQFRQMVVAHDRGEIPPLVMWGACPTRFDPSQAPPQRHTAFMWVKVPYVLRGDPRHWDDGREAFGEQLLRRWADFAPNVRGDNLLDWFARSPLDTERTLPNMHRGDLLVGSFAHGQVGANRPFAGAGQYRSGLPGLYLCGGSTHPGGNITGLCGYNAAGVIAADLEIEPWWHPRHVEQAWQELPC